MQVETDEGLEPVAERLEGPGLGGLQGERIPVDVDALGVAALVALGAVVLLLDALKGALAVVLALWLVPEAPRLHAAVGLAAFLGHVYPVWLKLHGGKGVATALGVLVVLVPLGALAGALVYAGLVAAWRVSSVGSLAGGVTAVAIASLTARAPEYAWLSALLFALIVWTHRSNIQRLLRHTERRF